MRLQVHTVRRAAARWAMALVALTFVTLTSPIAASGARAEPAAPGEAWRTSPFHRVPNAATGIPIPCVCVFRGQQYRVGEAVCMQTHMGTVIARCDLNLNNTTWAPTSEPCTVSRLYAPDRAPLRQSRAAPFG